ncbi:transcriptional regulator GcvA [Basfia succiniciproducens]|uniref:LysR family transcriptional regulator, glycine cleavage system transcriptional activator n=1 Tax=Basfia succiniciproducens TaxID=653940 RepID=A0A1G5BN88_9PAST|nr:transcriptional regulator GcvA [Basfia succiniciproducens]QIM68296.1 transcriptional regulator [Basfia succiniciproducens]SCX91360.1 LysR family transcriptional regulator, glycine cleavage system transcriptional activator [Basfia succiniciproducens]
MFKRLPPLNSLKAFESAARFLSFTKAADELCVTQAAVSHQIKLLEDFLNIRLFIRKNRSLELTELGKNYFQEISPILQKLADVTEKLKSTDNPHLTISVLQSFGINWLVPRLNRFNQLYPNIEVCIKSAEQDEGILGNDIDVAIYYGYGNWDNLKTEKLSEDNLLILASPKLLANNPVNSKDDLKHHTLIHVHTRDNWQNMATELGISDLNIHIGPLFSHTFMALQAAVHGQGIVLANSILAQQEIDNGNLQVVLPYELKDPKSFYVVSDTNRTNDQNISAFRQWIMQEMKYN